MRIVRWKNRPKANNRADIDQSLNPKDAWTIASFQLKLPVDQVDVHLADECDRIYLGDKCPKIDQKHQVQVWNAIVNRIKQQDESDSAHLQTRSHGIQPAMAFVIALCGLLIIVGGCFAMGLLTWQIDISWNNDRFEVEIMNNNDMVDPDEKMAIPTGLDTRLDQVLMKHGFSIALPTWVPEGFVFEDITEIIEPDFCTILSAYFTDGLSSIKISVTKYMVDEDVKLHSFVEKNDGPVEVISRGDVQYYLYGNLTTENAMWYQQSYSIKINGDISRDEIMKMIDSIHQET